MARRTFAPVVGLFSLALLSGCATGPMTNRYAYYRVPCTTPGAVVAVPIVLDPAGAAGATAAQPALPPAAASPTGAPLPVPLPSTCVIAVNERSYGGGYYPGPRYYGSFGLGIGVGSFGHDHHYGGHFGGGHFGGGHIGGHHGGHH